MVKYILGILYLCYLFLMKGGEEFKRVVVFGMYLLRLGGICGRGNLLGVECSYWVKEEFK